MADDYIRGEMDISEHKATFDGVMRASVYSAIITSLLVLYPTLIFAVGLGWVSSFIWTAVFGVVSGALMKQGVLYWSTFIGLAVITLVLTPLTILAVNGLSAV